MLPVRAKIKIIIRRDRLGFSQPMSVKTRKCESGDRVTYIKSESGSNRAYSVKSILDRGFEAASKHDWTQVSDLLKQLPQTTGKTKLFELKPADWDTAFNLALKMLIVADFQHKWEVAKLLPLFGSKIVVTLCNLVRDETIAGEVRWYVCKILGNFPEQRVILTLVELLQQTTDPELVSVTGKTLIEIGDRAIDALVDLLSQPKHRRLAVQALSYIRTTATIDPLIEVAGDSEPELRTIAISALSSFHDRRIPPVLVSALQDKASSVRKEAAIALGFRPELCQELDLVTHLQPLLQDLNLEVCRQAAIALGRMRQETANTALFEVLQADTTPIGLKSDLVKALGWSETASGISYLHLALNQESELVVREIAIALGKINTPELKLKSTLALLDLWQKRSHCSSTTKQILATSLGELRQSAAVTVLKQLSADSDRKVKLHAICALKKLR